MRPCLSSTVPVAWVLKNESDDNYNDAGNWFRKYGSMRDTADNVASSLPPEVFSWLSLARVALTILLRIGFLLVQIGSVPVTNINLIMLQNIVDFSWNTLIWLVVGFAIAYNGDVAGMIGQGRWIGSDPETIDKEAIIVGWQAAVIASAISTCLLVGRTHIVGYLVIGTLVSGLIQPFAVHWAWTSDGWMARQHFLGSDVTFRDFAGSTIVHTIGSIVGLIGCLVLGRRILRLRDIDDASIPADSAGVALAGYFLVLLGLQSMCFSSPSPKDSRTKVSTKGTTMIIVNNLLGSASCSLVVTALHFALGSEPFNHWTVMRCVQASIAGTTILAAGVNFYNPVVCLGLGFSAGIIHYLVSRRIHESALEDYCNVVATHLVCSIVGSLVSPLGHTSPTSQANVKAREAFAGVAWQCVCLVTVVTLVALPIAIAFVVLECLGLLRNRSEIVNHSRALVALERGPHRSYMQRLFVPEGETLYLQPCTVRVRRYQGDEVVSRLGRRERPTVKFQESSPGEPPSDTRKSSNTLITLATTKPNVSPQRSSIRVKKLRHIHTLGSIGQIAVCETSESEKAMGDNRRSDGDEEAEGFLDNDEKFHFGNESSMIECSGDFWTKRSGICENSGVPKVSGHLRLDKKCDVTYRDDSPCKNAKRRREPYRLRRTQKSTNLRLEWMSANDTSVKFLVRPNAQTVSGTESESSEDETYEIVAKNFSRILRDPDGVESTQKMLESTDVRA